MSNHDVTRRQFLNYTLLGVGGFMAAGLVLPMARFAIDPLLHRHRPVCDGPGSRPRLRLYLRVQPSGSGDRADGAGLREHGTRGRDG